MSSRENFFIIRRSIKRRRQFGLVQSGIHNGTWHLRLSSRAIGITVLVIRMMAPPRKIKFRR